MKRSCIGVGSVTVSAQLCMQNEKPGVDAIKFKAPTPVPPKEI